MKLEYEVGKTFYLVGERHSARTGEIVITKVGRKYAYYDKGTRSRIDIETGRVESDDGQFTIGRLWPDEASYNAAREIDRAWTAFRTDISQKYHTPKGMTLDKIKRMYEIFHET